MVKKPKISLDPTAGSNATNMYAVLLFAATNAARVVSQDISNAIDIQTLSELPIDRLLSVKYQFELPFAQNHQKQKQNEDNSSDAEDLEPQSRGGLDGAVAMPLRSAKPKNDVKRGGWEDDKGKKVQNIFQMSITTLAFLAFGGYLLCLVVHSLKGKGGVTKKIIVIQTSSTTAATVTAALRRRRRRRRPVRIRRPNTRNKRDTDGNVVEVVEEVEDGPTVDMSPHVDTEKMFDALVSLSEAYTRYHTVDYKRFNQTIIHF